MLRKPLDIVSLVSKAVVLKWARRCTRVTLDDMGFLVDLVVLPILDFNVILDMDWLSTHRVHTNCFAKMVTFQAPERRSITIVTQRGNALTWSFLAHIEGTKMSRSPGECW